MAPDTPTITIRPETEADHDAVRRVVAAAFGSETEALLVDRIRASPEYIPDMALVADLDGEIVGHVMISGATIRSDTAEARIVMLSPLAVAPHQQGCGIGGALVRAVTAIADRRDEPFVVLEGNPAYYSRFGFEHAALYDVEIDLPEWASPEAAQLMRLSSYDPSDETRRGRVVYPPAFDVLAGVEPPQKSRTRSPK